MEQEQSTVLRHIFFYNHMITWCAVQCESLIRYAPDKVKGSKKLGMALPAPPLFPLSHSDVTASGGAMTSLPQFLLLRTYSFIVRATEMTAQPS